MDEPIRIQVAGAKERDVGKGTARSSIITGIGI